MSARVTPDFDSPKRVEEEDVKSDGSRKSSSTLSQTVDLNYGEPLAHDPDFRGPAKDRSCTDIICTFLFLAFLIAWAILAIYAIYWGDPNKLLHPTDSKGRICGTSIPGQYNLTNKKYLLFFDLTKCISYATVFEGCPTPQVCIEKCPDDYFTYLELKLLDANPAISVASGRKSFEDRIKEDIYCVSDFDKSGLKSYQDVENAVKSDKCAPYTVASEPVVGRCIPKLLTDAGSELAEVAAKDIDQMKANVTAEDHNNIIPNATKVQDTEAFVKLMLQAKAIGEKILSDLHWSSWMLLIFLLVAGLLAFGWIILMRWISSIMVWTSIILVVTLLAAGTITCWYRYYILKMGKGIDFQLTLNVSSYLSMTDLWLVLAIIVSIVFVIIVLLLLFLRKRIQIAIAMIRESSKCVVYMMSALFFPIIPFIIQILAFAFFLYVAVNLASWSKPNCRRVGITKNHTDVNESKVTNGTRCPCDHIGTPEDPFCIFVNYTDNDYIIWLQMGNLFGLFWSVCFIDAFCQMSLAGAFASYYWAFRKPEDIPNMPVLRGVWRALRYHLGSIAFGSLILAIVKLIRVILEYLDDKLKNKENPVVEFFSKCLRCCFWCLEKFIKFLNKNAYIMIAIHGKNFCSSAKNAFLLLMRNVVRVFVLDKLTDFLLFLGKLVITVGFGVLSYFFFSGHWEGTQGFTTDNLNFFFVPIIVVVVGTYLICCAFFDVYEMAVDTTFLCFLEDSERNDGSPEKPYFMSKNLMKILNKKNHFHKIKKED